VIELGPAHASHYHKTKSKKQVFEPESDSHGDKANFFYLSVLQTICQNMKNVVERLLSLQKTYTNEAVYKTWIGTGCSIACRQ
jgi:hypothetical protein